MSIAQNLRTVRERIAEAAVRSGRPPDAVRLVGVSKGMPVERMAEAANAGLRDIGENRVQEAATKIPTVDATVAQPPNWHLVGHLQTNKAGAALGLFDTIQSVDSVRVAQTLSRLADRPVPIFLEVQFVRAPDRFGFDPDEIEAALGTIGKLPNLNAVGLMTVGPLGLTEEDTRQVFRRLRERRDQLTSSRPGLPPLELSMGMTDDYAIAIEEGATVVRIGRAIFAAGA
jgi:hypothetical protein